MRRRLRTLAFEMSRAARRLATATVAILSLLFAQLAWAVYVCPAAMDAAVMAQMAAMGEPCEGMDTQQPALCHQHAVGVAQSFEAVKVLAPSLPLIVQVFEVPLVIERPLDLPRLQAGEPQPRPPPEPVFLATLRLRV